VAIDNWTVKMKNSTFCNEEIGIANHQTIGKTNGRNIIKKPEKNLEKFILFLIITIIFTNKHAFTHIYYF
jgi:hypothetical protein